MEETRNVFISLPMHDRSDDFVKARMQFIFELAQKRFHGDLKLINTMLPDDIPDKDAKNPKLWYLGRSISLLCNADLVIFDCDYKEANGCQIEKAACILYGIPYYILDNNPEVD